jgi:hypothetical protein
MQKLQAFTLLKEIARLEKLIQEMEQSSSLVVLSSFSDEYLLALIELKLKEKKGFSS